MALYRGTDVSEQLTASKPTLVYPEDRGSKLLRNYGTHIPIYTVHQNPGTVLHQSRYENTEFLTTF
jgi:hypothetical protein